MSLFRRLVPLTVAACMFMLLLARVASAQGGAPLVQVRLAHGITPPAVDLARRGLAEARALNATALIIEVPDGAGVNAAAWTLAREIASSPVPVVVWLGPGRVQGGPAGALLLAASDVAAMAPDATAGFAYPLAPSERGFSERTQSLVVDDVVKQVTRCQRQHNRDEEWIERAIRQGATIDAERARAAEPPVIDVVAATSEELRAALTGRVIAGGDGQQRNLESLGAPEIVVAPSFLEQLAQLLAVPTVAFVLFVLGAIALYLELANPGIGVPGVAGATLLVAALYGFFQASVSPLALVLLIAGLVLIGLEHVVLSHGGLTLGGVVLLVVGALTLVDRQRAPGLGVTPLAIAITTGMLVLAAVGLATMALRSKVQPPATGPGALIGQIAEVRRPMDPEGMVFVAGALWSAWTDEGPLHPGELVEVAGIDNLRLYVRRIQREPGSLNV